MGGYVFHVGAWYASEISWVPVYALPALRKGGRKDFWPSPLSFDLKSTTSRPGTKDERKEDLSVPLH